MQSLNVYIETYGCQMNEYDSELVRSILDKEGHTFTTNERDAHVILLNTCAIRENAHSKIYHRLQQLKHVKAKSRDTVTVGVLGCMAQNLRDELLDSHHEVDFIAGPDSPPLMFPSMGSRSSISMAIPDIVLMTASASAPASIQRRAFS